MSAADQGTPLGWEPPPPAGRPSRRRPDRSQVLPVLVAIACALLAAVVMRISEPAQDYDVSRAVLGQPTQLDDGEVTLTAVRAGTQISRDGEIALRTQGVFLVLDFTMTAGDTRYVLGTADLTGDGRTYKPYSSFATSVAPGFQVAGSVVFEVDPAHMTDLVFTLRRAETLSGYQQRLVARLGITRGNVDQWRASAAGRVLEVAEYPVEEPVR